MSWTNRVIWQEGMFLRAQHFQQQDRWVENLVRARVARLRPYPWGVTELAIDRDLLAVGRFAVLQATGIFEDGTLFTLPRDDDHPTPLDLTSGIRNQVIYLALPIGQAGSVEVAYGEASEARLGLSEFEAYDTHSASPLPAGLQVGRLRMRYLLEDDNRAGYLCIGIARVQEVGADKRVVLDDRWVAPSLAVAATPLSGLVTELTGMMNQRAEALAARLAQPGTRGVAEVTDFLMLQTLNRWQTLLAHWAEDGLVHPSDLYGALLQVAGEFATFTDTVTRRPQAYPPYRHEDLQRSFAPIVADIRRALAAVIESNAVAISLVEKRHGVRVGQIVDRTILRGSLFVLAVRADVPAETLRQRLPGQIKVGSVEDIVNLVNVQLPGIQVSPMAVAPRQLPFYGNAVYFELDRNAKYWANMQNSGGFAIHVSGDFPGLWMELWAVRGA